MSTIKLKLSWYSIVWHRLGQTGIKSNDTYTLNCLVWRVWETIREECSLAHPDKQHICPWLSELSTDGSWQSLPAMCTNHAQLDWCCTFLPHSSGYQSFFHDEIHLQIPLDIKHLPLMNFFPGQEIDAKSAMLSNNSCGLHRDKPTMCLSMMIFWCLLVSKADCRQCCEVIMLSWVQCLGCWPVHTMIEVRHK